MSWAVGWDSNWYRDIGYGVPATCEEPAARPPSVFISYRRQDSSGYTGRLYDRLTQSMNTVLREPGFRDRVLATGAQVRGSTSRAEFAAFIRKDNESWGRIVRQFNVTVS